MAKRVHVVIADPSEIIRSGVIAVLQRSPNLNIDIAEISEASSMGDDLVSLRPDIIIINPSYFGHFTPAKLREYVPNMQVIALYSALMDQATMKSYDESISIFDSSDTIRASVSRVIETEEDVEVRNELSQREKEIVVCVSKGLSNKEIADMLSLSTHTVISHRRNIASKLNIHSPSGLTIYAIVNKLIDIDLYKL